MLQDQLGGAQAQGATLGGSAGQENALGRKPAEIRMALKPMENQHEVLSGCIRKLQDITNRLGGVVPEKDTQDKVHLGNQDSVLGAIQDMVTSYGESVGDLDRLIQRLEELV